jgi:glycosyltransferase involved in cell wall biosynthesis
MTPINSISIGIFAHNEADNIVATLDSLAEQDIFSSPVLPRCEVTVSILANGCTDDTVAIATAYLTQTPNLSAQVLVIEKAGKSSAWNEFIHSNRSESVDYFVCMDSDITFGSDKVLSTLITRLSRSEEAYLAVDVAQKDTLLKPHKTIFEKLSLFFSRIMKKDGTAVAGSLYCAKGDQIRKVYMPDGLPVEDGFLRAMLVTELFTKKDNNQRILVVDDVCHYFTPDSSIRSLFRHEERLLIGTFINSIIYGYLWHQVAETGIDAGSLVACNNRDQPNWVEGLINSYRETHDPLIPSHFYHKYWKRWVTFNLWAKVLTFPVIILASVIKYFLLKKVEQRLLRESGLGYW